MLSIRTSAQSTMSLMNLKIIKAVTKTCMKAIQSMKTSSQKQWKTALFMLLLKDANPTSSVTLNLPSNWCKLDRCKMNSSAWWSSWSRRSLERSVITTLSRFLIKKVSHPVPAQVHHHRRRHPSHHKNLRKNRRKSIQVVQAARKTVRKALTAHLKTNMKISCSLKSINGTPLSLIRGQGHFRWLVSEKEKKKSGRPDLTTSCLRKSIL